MTKPENSKNNSYINREISWLQFNARVLQEAADESVPLIERLRFLGIFSNNLDEFFKVRYATVKRIVEAGKGGKSELGGIKAKELLEIITQIVIKQQSESVAILNTIDSKLKEENIEIFGLDTLTKMKYPIDSLKLETAFTSSFVTALALLPTAGTRSIQKGHSTICATRNSANVKILCPISLFLCMALSRIPSAINIFGRRERTFTGVITFP